MENDLEKLTNLIRYYILLATTSAGSGHATSSLSAVELMTVLFFKHFRYDLDNPANPGNDHLIFSKGHASPLFYSLFAAAGKITEEKLKTLRDFKSELEGHPTMRFAYTEAPTGSLGQGLSVGVGIALNEKYLDKTVCRAFVLLGDGELAEGQVWEAVQIAARYKLNNLVAIVDVNKLGQSGETMLGHDIESYRKRFHSFGWRSFIVKDGHNLHEIEGAFDLTLGEAEKSEKPAVIIAKTVKGKGVSFIEDKVDWHGKALSKEEFEKAVLELGDVDKTVKGEVAKPFIKPNTQSNEADFDAKPEFTNYEKGEMVATRKAYGTGIVELGKRYNNVVALDADVKNSTFAIDFVKAFPDRYFEMFIAEQNMVSCALGLAHKGKVPFVSTFGAFLTRAYDQIRMAKLAGAHIIFAGSHTGVSIGEDGPSQMGLEDIAMFRVGLNTSVFYPCDAISTEKLIEEAYKEKGIVYIRTTRSDTPVIYDGDEEFEAGGSKVLKSGDKDKVTLVAAGITLHEALKASELLKKEGIEVGVIDLYSVKPIDETTLRKEAKKTKRVITVEDHYIVGGMGDAVLEVLANEEVLVYKMGITKVPRSGRPEELLDYEDIFAYDIVRKVKELLEVKAKTGKV